MAHRINQGIINNVIGYRNNMDAAIWNFFQGIMYLQQSEFDFFATPNYKLYSMISDNIRMDLGYLMTTNIDYDPFGFIGVRRNLRNSIEAYYDLYNITCNECYFYFLKYSHNPKICTAEEIEIIRSNYKDYFNNSGLRVKTKAEIAKKAEDDIVSGQKITEDFYTRMKGLSEESNAYVHPDIFTETVTDDEKDDLLRNFIATDCELLAKAFDLMVQYCRKYYPSMLCSFNPFLEWGNLQTYLSTFTNYIETY
jgi:hypothetical protein